MRHLFSLIVGLFSSCLLFAQDPCEVYSNVEVSLTQVNPPGLFLQLTDNTADTLPVIDSVWITHYAYHAHPEVLITANVQSGDTIDLSPLSGKSDSYRCWIRIGDCVKIKDFFYSGEDWNYCIEYAEYHLAVVPHVYNETVEYDLSNNGNLEPLTVDSVWITKDEDRQTKLIVSYAKARELIDASSLPKDCLRYAFWAQVGDCVKGRVFIFRRSQSTDIPTTTDDYPACDNVTKIIRDGQLFILRDGKTYDLQGQEMR